METENLIQRDSIKLTKNTKGFNWEFKIMREPDETIIAWVNRLAQVNAALEKEYGNQTS